MRFRDRADAGKKLAQALKKYEGQNGVVYALPRGGVVLARKWRAHWACRSISLSPGKSVTPAA